MEDSVNELVRLVTRLVKDIDEVPGGWVIPWEDGLMLALLIDEIEEDEERVRLDRAVMKAVTEVKAGTASACSHQVSAPCLKCKG